MNLHSIPIILIRHFPMVRVSFVSKLTRQSDNTRQKVHIHIEACHDTAALYPNLLDIRRAKFDSHHSQHAKEALQRSSHAQKRYIIIQMMHKQNGPCVFARRNILTSRVKCRSAADKTAQTLASLPMEIHVHLNIFNTSAK